MPSLVFAMLVGTVPAWPLFAILAFELAVGGLDNLLSHHRVPPRRSRGAAACSASARCSRSPCVLPAYARPLVDLAAVVSVVGVRAEFWRGRDYYLDKRIRDKAARAAASPEPST